MGWRERNRPDGSGFIYWIGKKWHLGGMHRHPRTTQERRLWDQEYGRRARRKLRTAYDDILRSDFGHHSWKRHRRHQWKAKE